MTDKTEEFEKARQEVRAILEKQGDKVPPKARPLIEDVITKMKVDHLLPKQALGFTPQIMEVIYQHGYHLFQNGKYQDALLIFNFLRQLDITQIKYSFAIAACHHYSKEYLDAAANYLIYKYMDPFNPVPCFHLYDCYLKANYPISALAAIEEALVLAGLSPRHEQLKEKIQLELQYLKEILKNNFKDKYEPSASDDST
jgi:type III secretion system low calcium response chaperone LcrH/SycD